MYLAEQLYDKWAPVLDHADMPKFKDSYRKATTAKLLEQTVQVLNREAGILTETTPANAVAGGMSPVAGSEGNIKGFDPILIGLLRRSLPQMIAYDVCGVQPLSGPSGLIFALRSKYANVANSPVTIANEAEALFDEADTDFSGTGTHQDHNKAANTFVLANTGRAVTTSTGEDFGGATAFGQMGFVIERINVVANTRALKAEYTVELAQDLKAIHGLDAETELTNILSSEILAETNREVIRTIYATAIEGAVGANVYGTFDLDLDADGRWAVEKYKGLVFQIEREANAIGKAIRRGKGNFLIVSTDVASALSLSGLLDYQSALKGVTSDTLNVDENNTTFVGTLAGKFKVHVDPYSVAGQEFVVVGYKGGSAWDAGLYYCPYVPLQLFRAQDPNTFQPKIGFKTRYGLVANPFGTSAGTGALSNKSNYYYRKFKVAGL